MQAEVLLRGALERPPRAEDPGCEAVVEEPGRLVVLRGRLDVRAAADVRAVLLEQLLLGTGRLVLDLSGVPAVDATGLGLLVGTHRRAERAERELVLRGVPVAVGRLLVLSRLDRVLRQEHAQAVGAA